MTISSTDRTSQLFTSGSTFPFDFKIFQASDLVVVEVDLTTGAETTLAITTDYSIDINVNQEVAPGGSIELVAGTLPADIGLYITSSVPYTQPTTLTNNGPYFAQVVMTMIDRATILCQQLLGQVNRSIRLPLSESGGNTVLPIASERANTALIFDAFGNPTCANIDISGQVIIAQQAAIDAYAAQLAAEAAAAGAAAPMPFLSARALGFDHTGVIDCGTKLQALLNDNVNYPRGFILMKDQPGGKYRYGGSSVNDNGKTYQVWGLGGGVAGSAPTEILMTTDVNSRDHIRVQANDVKWLNVSINGEQSTTVAPTYNPRFFVVGYNGATGAAARNFTLTGTIWNTPGNVIHWCQGNGMVLDIRGSNLWKPLIYAPSTAVALPYRGGDDTQNGKFTVQLTRSHDWTFYSEDGSLCGSHDFRFWKQYDSANGIKLTIGGNRGIIYTEYTRINTDNSPKTPPGIPYQQDNGSDFVLFSGGTDDCNWVNDNNLGQTVGLRGTYLSKAQGYGALFTNISSKRFQIYEPGAAGNWMLRKRTDNSTMEIVVDGTGNSANVDLYHSTGARARLRASRIGFYDDNGAGSSQIFMKGLQSKTIEVNHISIGDNLTAGSSYSVTLTTQVADLKRGDFITVSPVETGLPLNVSHDFTRTADGSLTIRVHNTGTTTAAGWGGIDWHIAYFNLVTTA